MGILSAATSLVVLAAMLFELNLVLTPMERTWQADLAPYSRGCGPSCVSSPLWLPDSPLSKMFVIIGGTIKYLFAFEARRRIHWIVPRC